MGILRPELLADHHQLEGFVSLEDTIDEWLVKWARISQSNHSARTYVICEDSVVIGYYCLAAGAVGRQVLSSRLRHQRPDPVPAIVLGRLGIDHRYQGRGLGTYLLRDAALRVLQLTNVVGVAALLVHALSPTARDFYLAHNFMVTKTEPLTLYLPTEQIRQTFME